MPGTLCKLPISDFSQANNLLNGNYLFHHLLPSSSDADVAHFYRNTHVFITGGTGFVGKALVEKLLRSCPSIKGIYLLMRPKKGKDVHERLEQLLQNQVFDRLREESSLAFKKIIPISGDTSLLNLGISNQELSFLLDNVNVVFHSAATVRFDESLKTALIYNTLATKRVLDFCCSLKALKSFVYVSTAFSNADKVNVNESVYEMPYNPEDILSIIDALSKDAMKVVSQKLLGKHPNTYTLSKAMAEHIVLAYSKKIPTSIVRPSIITAAWKEPFPGWVESLSGITGIVMECGRGTIKSILCNEEYRMELVPVDVVVNTLITSAWHTVNYRSNSLNVYNCTSGEINPITWKKFKSYILVNSREYPSKYVTWYPGFVYRSNRLLHVFFVTLYHILPSAILDLYLRCIRKKPIMLKVSLKFFNALLAGSFVSTNEWNFEVSTMRNLVKVMKGTKDAASFEIDISNENGFVWKEYVKSFHLGIRHYILKDDIASVDRAKRKLNRLYWFQKAIEFVFVCLILNIFFYCINKWCSDFLK